MPGACLYPAQDKSLASEARGVQVELLIAGWPAIVRLVDHAAEYGDCLREELCGAEQWHRPIFLGLPVFLTCSCGI